MNSELERRKEFERRKKLRLLQVRQQSKEFADKLRERIKGEFVKQKTKYLEAENKLKQEKHLKELCQLKEIYDKCLASIGNGHKEAAKQPDINLEKHVELDRISAQAAKRGSKAMKKQLEDKSVLEQKHDAPIKQKKAIRNKENLRAFFISSLPNHVEHSRVNSNSTSKISYQNRERTKTTRVLDEIPSNINVFDSRVTDLQNRDTLETLNGIRKESKGQGKERLRRQELPVVAVIDKPTDSASIDSSTRECSCDYTVCFCHKNPRELRRCSSESRLSSDKVSDNYEPIKKTVRRRSYSPRSVRTLNYFGCGNVYEGNQPSSVRVTHHSRSPKRTEEEPNTNTVLEVPILKPSIEELKKRAEERSTKALKKEQIKKDFQQLIQNLKKLSQEKSVISSKNKRKPRIFASERDINSKNTTKQKKLNDAFEKLPHSLKSHIAQNTVTENQQSNQNLSNDSSPPTLNLALYQTNMSRPVSRRVMSEITISDTPSGYGGSKKIKPRTKSTSSSSRIRSESPNVLVKRDPSGDVHITVKVSEVLAQANLPSPKTKRSQTSPTSDTSYMSPPSNLTPSQQHLLEALLSQVNKRGIGDEMRKYIQKLLNMSRESIDNLHSQSRPQSPLDKDLEQDFIKLNQLAETYAENMNTLVDMYEQMSSPSSPAEYLDPVRAPPSIVRSRTPTPMSTRSTSPTMRPLVCPPPVERFRTPSPTQNSSPSPMSSGYGQVSQPTYIPQWTPEQIQESVSRYSHPERPQTETPSYIPAMPIPTGPWGSPHIPPVAPPRSQDSKIPIVSGRPPRAKRSPPTPLQPYNRTATPFKPPSQSTVHYTNKRVGKRRQPICPKPTDSFSPQIPSHKENQPNLSFMEHNTRPDLDTSQINSYLGSPSTEPPLPTRNENRRVKFPQELGTPVVRGLETSATSADTMELMFGGISGVKVPTREQLQAMSAKATSLPSAVSPPPGDWDLEAVFAERRQKILQGGADKDRISYSPDKRVQAGSPQSSVRGSPQSAFSSEFLTEDKQNFGFDGFRQDFKDFENVDHDFDTCFTDNDFNMGIDAILQEEARPDDYVDYPDDFPPPTNVFGPGFDWETANFDRPNFPRSFPGEPLAGHSMSSKSGNITLDTSFDTSALQGPVNADRLNAMREKLSNICNDQYRNILEMLKEDATTHQLAYGNLLKRATSDPFLDPNTTLAPIGSPAKSYSGSEYTVPHQASQPDSLGRGGFEATGRTPPGDRRIKDYSGSVCPDSPEFDTRPEYCDFSDEYSNLDNLMLLLKNHQERQ